MRGLLSPPADRIRTRQRRLLAIAFAVWAVLSQAFIPAFHHHDGVIGGWHQQNGSNQPDQDGDDDCPICQVAHAIGAAVLPVPPSHYILEPVILGMGVPDLPGHIDQHKNDRPRQRAPPPLI